MSTANTAGTAALARAHRPARTPLRPRRVSPVVLPHRSTLAKRYGSEVAHLPVYAGPDVAGALRRRGAHGAAVDGAVFLPSTAVTADLAAHEVVHALQQTPATAGGAARLDLLETAPAVGAGSPSEREAEVLARPASDEQGTAPPSVVLPDGVIALRRTGGGDPGPREMAPPPTPEHQREGTGTAAAAPSPVTSENVATDRLSQAVTDGAISPTFTPPPAPESALDPAVAAERAAAKAEAEAALTAAESPSAVMNAYAGMAPSVQALHSPGLTARLGATTASSSGELIAEAPEVSAHLSGETANLPSPPPILVPGGQAAASSSVPAAPTVEVPDGPEQPELHEDLALIARIREIFSLGATEESVGDQLEEVSTDNPGIRTEIERADIPLEGASDPERMDADAAARAAEAESARVGAAAAVVAGPGPEMIVPRAMEHTVAVTAPAPVTAALLPPEGAVQLTQMALPPEVVARFDQDTGPAMTTTALAARDQITTAETDRDSAHAAAVQTAETDRTAAEREADTHQRDEIISRRRAIQRERQRTVDEQQAAVVRVDAEAETARVKHRADADAQVEVDRARIDARYDQAERDSRATVAEGERDAKAERARAEREAEDQSWWDRATDFISRAFAALTSVITDIFDAVRSLVTRIIDAAVSAVTILIEAAAAALQRLVSAFGELLKGLVDGLLGEIFPGLAARLTGYIDDAVTAVNQAIDVVAAGLVAAVERIGAALNAAVNALLDAFQSTLNSALAVLEAALTGDWGALLRKVLDAVLGILGIDPVAFHAMIAQAPEAIGTIVNDPGRFLTNLLGAVVGGVRGFAGNFGTHLRSGIIGWLTGALGPIEMPERWDIWGVLDIARQVLGLTWDFVRERAARIVGEENVARLEAAFSWIATLVTEGWSGLWERISGELHGLKDTVMDAIRGFVLEKVVLAAISWLAGLFSPVGALVKLVMTIWNVFQFVSNQLQRLFGIAQAVVAGLAAIAQGVLGPAMLRVEQVLAQLLPVVIDLLMSLLGVTGVARRVREIIGTVRARIARAVDRVIDRALGALGGGRSRSRRGDAGAAGTGARGQLGRDMRVDVAEGKDHTLSIERGGEGGATVMLRSTPRPVETWLTRLSDKASRMRDAAKKERVETNIDRARGLLGPLDTTADRTAATASGARSAAGDRPAARGDANAELTSQEQQLVEVLESIFNDVGAADLLARYETEINRIPEPVQPTIRTELSRHPARYIGLTNWSAVVEEMKARLPLFAQPLAQRGSAASDMTRAIITGAYPVHIVKVEEAQGKVTNQDLLRFMVATVVTDGPDQYVELHRQIVLVLLGRASRPSADSLREAVGAALRTLAARGTAEVDAALRAAIKGSTVVDALITIAEGGSVGGIDETRLEELWEQSVNVNHVKDAFRAAMPGQHEWIPSNYILRVVRTASAAGRRSEESAEEAAIWINVQHEWRTRTTDLIFKPDYSSRTVGGSKVLQGHSGAIYAETTDGRITPQTVKQNVWHNELRRIFRVQSQGSGSSRERVAAVMGEVGNFIGQTVWKGRASQQLRSFSNYYTSTDHREEFTAIIARGRASGTRIQADFARARGVIGG